jgi:MFS family permease
LLSGRLRGTATLAPGFVASTALLALALFGIGLVPSAAWLLPLGFVTGAGNGVLNVTLSSLVMGRTSDAERGRVGAALLTGVASGTQLVAFAGSGALAAVLSPRTVFVLAGGLGALAPLLVGRSVVRAASSCDRADSAGMTPTPTPA